MSLAEIILPLTKPETELGGSALVIVIDPASRSVMLYDGASSRRLTSADTLRHSALPEFELPLGAYFSQALDRL